MIECPKCGKKIPKKSLICPQCHKRLIKSVPPQNFKLKSTPLKVKKSSTIKDKAKLKSNLSNTTYRSSTSLITFLIIALVIINLVLILNFINTKNNTEIKEDSNNNQEIIETSKLGSWIDQNNGLFIFTKDNNFIWYDSYLVQNDNYYKGTYDYKVGLEALKEMGYTEEEFYITFGKDLKLDNVYSINLYPQILIENKNDLSYSKLSENESWWYLLIIQDDNAATAYNKTLDLRHTLTRYQNR